MGKMELKQAEIGIPMSYSSLLASANDGDKESRYWLSVARPVVYEIMQRGSDGVSRNWASASQKETTL